MRSSFFVFVSVFVHAACVAAIGLSQMRPQMPVSASAGNNTIEMSVGQPAPSPVVEQVKVAKAANRKTRVVTVPMEKVRDTKLPAKEVPIVEDTKLDPEISESETEAAESAQEEEETTPEQDSAAEVAHGGDTQEGAVSYLDLKQAPGNRSPMYPMGARRENRQGLVELVYRVTKEGDVADLQIAKSSGHKDLDLEAARAISAFKFVPGQEGWARHPVSFNLKGESAPAPSKLRSAQAE